MADEEEDTDDVAVDQPDAQEDDETVEAESNATDNQDDGENGDTIKQIGGEDDEDENEHEEAEEPAEKIEPKPLTLSVMQKCLAMLCKTSSGLQHAFVKFDCRNQQITDVSLLGNYPHLRYIDLSHNDIGDVSPLRAIRQLLLLNCDYNRLQQFQLTDAPYLRLLSLAGNQLESCSGLSFPMLEHFILSFNQLRAIDSLQPDRLSQLHTIELRGNQLSTTKGLRLPSLRNLYVAQNKLERLDDIAYNTGLKVLHARDNRLSNLTGFTAHMLNLEYINLRQNKLEKSSQLRKLQVLPRLAVLALGENPVATEDEYRVDVVAYLPRLTRLDKDDVNDDLRSEAEVLAAKRLEEDEEEEEQNNTDQQPAGDDTTMNGEQEEDA